MPVHTYGYINIDVPLNGDLSVLSRLAGAFAVHETSPLSMAVSIDAGALFVSGNVLEVAAQTSALIEAPLTASRIDRITVNNSTGVVLVVTGVEAEDPVPPAIPAGHAPLAQIQLASGVIAITNAIIQDERVAASATSPGGLIGIQTFTESGVYTATPGTSRIVVRIVGGGGSGGSTAATASSKVACGSGGGAGAYAEALIGSGFDGVTVTVGAGGASPAAGANDGYAGGASSFGDLVIAPGGTKGTGSAAYSAPLLWGGKLASDLPTGGNIVSAAGTPGGMGIALSSTIVLGGTGGCSVFGGAGMGSGISGGHDATAPGAGGGGAGAIASKAAFQGGAGADGIVIINEYA